MVLSKELVDELNKEIEIKRYFQNSTTCTPKHEVYEQFIKETKWKDLPKVIFYILMDAEFSHRIGKSASGNIGYYLHLTHNNK